MPKDILPMETMIVVEMEFQLLEARMKTLAIPLDSSKVLFEVFSDEIYEKLNVDKTEYEKSYKYYMDDIEGMDEIYAAVIDSLSLREALQE